MISQSIQILGALLLLAAFFLSQRGVLDPASRRYLFANLGGGALLAVDAVVERQWGFFLLEASWAIVAGMSLFTALRASRLKDRPSTR